MTDIDALTLNNWAHGVDPIDSAVRSAAILIEQCGVIEAARNNNPNAFPLATWPCTCPKTLANKIVALFLNAGWTPPDDISIAAALKAAADRMAVTSDQEIVDEYGAIPPPGYVAKVRAGLKEQAVLYQRRAAELDPS